MRCAAKLQLAVLVRIPQTDSWTAQLSPHLSLPACRYNISNFDLPYLIDRAAALKLTKFPYWGRLKNKCDCRRVCTCSYAQFLA